MHPVVLLGIPQDDPLEALHLGAHQPLDLRAGIGVGIGKQRLLEDALVVSIVAALMQKN